MNKYTIKSYEEECGEELFVLKVPEGISKEEVFKKLEIANRYSRLYTEEYDDLDNVDNLNCEDFDEHLQEMIDVAHTIIGNGQEYFNYYLEDICGWEIEEIEEIKPDFEYEW